MSGWKVTLLGQFTVECNRTRLVDLEARQIQELFSYLLLFRHRPQPRESLLETLWGDQSSGKARKKLRQILWRLKSTLDKQTNSAGPELQIDNDWIQIFLPGNFWLDTEEFEKIVNAIVGKSIKELSASDLRKMQNAVNIYKGDLLEGWYSDWCVFERERFQTMQLTLLDKLVQTCEIQHKYELGLSYATELLRYDQAYERAHYQLMMLHFLSGNRTQALHQYARCVIALRQELDVEPSDKTKQLYEQIRSNSLEPSLVTEEKMSSRTGLQDKPPLRDILSSLKEVSTTLSRLEHQIKEEIVTLTGTHPRNDSPRF
jgi:DNA-binding SARP family transcriptional activator